MIAFCGGIRQVEWEFCGVGGLTLREGRLTSSVHSLQGVFEGPASLTVGLLTRTAT